MLPNCQLLTEKLAHLKQSPFFQIIHPVNLEAGSFEECILLRSTMQQKLV
jgi:hypothetical protein